MFSRQSLLFALVCIGIVSCERIVCDFNDAICVTESAERTLKGFVAGFLGVEPSDPLTVNLIEGDLPTLKYKLINASLIGIKNCHVDLTQILTNNMTYNYHLRCPHLILESDYDVKGKLGPELIEGTGTCKLNIYDYHFLFNGDYEKYTDTNGKLHIQLINHILKYEAKDKVNYDCKNLFNGDKEKSDSLHKYANENWLFVHKQTRQPAMEAFMQKFIDHSNAFLKIVALEDFLYRESL